MSGPGQKNNFAKKAKKMTIPLQMDNKDYGKKSKAVARTIHNVDSSNGAFYGTRTIMTKESFINYLIQESEQVQPNADLLFEDDEVTSLPDTVIGELKKNITAGAKDLAQAWKHALELVHKAYQVANVARPESIKKGAWKQYENLLAFGVQALRKARGVMHGARLTKPIMSEAEEVAQLLQLNEFAPNELRSDHEVTNHIGKHRFFVQIPGAGAAEIDAKNMDEIIDMISNRIKNGREVKGTKVRVEERSKSHAIITVWVNDIKRDRFIIKDVS